MLKRTLDNCIAFCAPVLRPAAMTVPVLALLLGGSPANADLVNTGTPCSTSSVSGSTACAGIYEGNDSNQDLDGLFGVSDWTEILKLDSNGGTETSNGITLIVDSSSNKTWSVDTYAGNDPVMFVLKGGDSFSAFLMDISVLSGTWDNQSMLKGNDQPGPDLSHWAIYSGGTTVVPLPAAAWLFGSALLGMAGIGYRRTGKS